MKKNYICILLIFIAVISLVLSSMRYTFFESESLKNKAIVDNNISIIGDYIFYESKSGLVGIAKNLKTDEKKIVGIGLYNVNVYDDEIYYFAQRSVNPESFFCKRGIKSLLESRVTPSRVSSYKFYNGYLYFQKYSYSTDEDGNENGYIYRMDLDTKKTEKLIALRTRGFDIVNDTIYYIRYSKEGYERYNELLCDGIFSYSLVNGKEKLIVDGWIGDFAIHGNDIVYSEYILEHSDNESNGKYHLSWLDLALNETIEISKDINVFRLYNDNICYTEKETSDVINIINCSTEKETSVIAKNIDCAYGFVLYGENIYYYDIEHNLCRNYLET